jgi:hypothetical protein
VTDTVILTSDELRRIVASARTAGAQAILQNYLRLIEREASESTELREAIEMCRDLLERVTKEGV